ncbi:Hypothetical predicted protein [Podarcis lilfordi]|uniref:Uncharacterized protein n=1 Tax=Podarcis lilfordi TaxID=74358 RepID=A0AA35NXQ5_9SAUR|nr:Hypothetical predicted protein [Podarcis lilfordi]
MMAYPGDVWPRAKDSHRWADSNGSGRWNLRRIQKKEAVSSPLPDYQQYLHRLLGSERASYFLRPPTKEQPVSPRVKRLLVTGLDMGAEEVWMALHEEPKRQREAAAAKKGRSLSQQVPWLGRPSTTQCLQQVSQQRQQLCAMHRLGKQHQRTASHLLATKHLADLGDPYGTEGPRRYFHFSLNHKRVQVCLA